MPRCRQQDWQVRNKLAKSRCNGIWETTRHNRQNGLSPVPNCYGLVEDLLRGSYWKNWCNWFWPLLYRTGRYWTSTAWLKQHLSATYILQIGLLYIHCVSEKTRKIWNGIAQNYRDRFWWHLAEIFKILQNTVCTLQFSSRFAFRTPKVTQILILKITPHAACQHGAIHQRRQRILIKSMYDCKGSFNRVSGLD